ncbi:hypothetical protein EIN_451260 [Entamoeba invadens IP1]|uniref:Uncharacterized protein n=1 Tax=Entamoeba invadens IP1 TaxID=370355 RepID=A0A0A1U993_ENTIV|nr:hypothetical protein EIN_451260 [Entamoeba invadens IP1]ELP91525.1 hypothetical protein EIN_451260 [Entamoeba invadens IP1]|eukprot:XP_004258296.1 hypothetical protein EIN_451260 [Entamoeba invadens IP1]
METITKALRINPRRSSDKSLYSKRDLEKPTFPTKNNTTKPKVYIQKVTDEKALAKQRKDKKSTSVTVKLLSQRRKRISRGATVINAEIINLTQSKGLPPERLTKAIESELPEYNLGEYFSAFPEPLYNIPRKSRHLKISEDTLKDLNERLKTETSKVVLSSTSKTQKVFYELVDTAAAIGISREPILVSLFYNYGVLPLNNLSRRAAKFMNDFKKSGEHFLKDIQKKFEAEKDERDLKILIQRYTQVDGNIKTIEAIIKSLNNTIQLLKDPDSKICVISKEGYKEFVYDEESIEMINKIIQLKNKQIEELKRQNYALVEHNDELKRLTKYNTLHYILVMENNEPRITDLDIKASYLEHVNKSEVKVKQIANEKEYKKDVYIPKDIIERYLPKLNGKVRDKVDEEFIPKVDDVNAAKKSSGKKVVSQEALDIAKKNIYEISFTDPFKYKLFKRTFTVFGRGRIDKVPFKKANYPRRVEKYFGALVMKNAKKIYLKKIEENSTELKFIRQEDVIVATNNITTKMFDITRENLRTLIRTLFQDVNHRNIKAKTLHISGYEIVENVYDHYS